MKIIWIFFLQISRASIDACKDYFREDLQKADWALMVELKKLFEIMWFFAKNKKKKTPETKLFAIYQLYCDFQRYIRNLITSSQGLFDKSVVKSPNITNNVFYTILLFTMYFSPKIGGINLSKWTCLFTYFLYSIKFLVNHGVLVLGGAEKFPKFVLGILNQSY